MSDPEAAGIYTVEKLSGTANIWRPSTAILGMQDENEEPMRGNFAGDRRCNDFWSPSARRCRRLYGWEFHHDYQLRYQ
jgi:hypothetical protein